MKKKIIDIIQNVSNLGVEDNQDLFDQQRIRLLNQIMMIAFALQFSMLLQSLLQLDYKSLIFGVGMMFVAVIPLHLNCQKKTQLAIWYFCVYAPFSMASIMVLYGDKIQINYSYIIFSVHLIIFLTSFLERLIFTAFVASLYYGAFEYSKHFPAPLEREFSLLEENTIFIASFLFIIFVLKSYTDLVKSSFLKIQALLKEQIKKKQIIEIQNEELLIANSELEKFAYIASHDLKSPLRNISSFINLIERKIKKGQSEGLLEDLGYAKRASQQMYSLIEDILCYSRMREQELSFENISLMDVVTQVVYNLQTIFEEQKVVLISDDLPTIEGNHAQLVLLFQNLFENGIKYNKSEQPAIQIKKEEQTNEYVIISVTDNGIGIPINYQYRVFEMFMRLHNQQEYEGTGLGLAICKRIANLHQGDISLKSEIAKGSTFFVKLPIVQNKQFSETASIEKATIEKPRIS
jgi:signal transduction histidine kinase